jgi:adenosylcobinamide-phosphate synthase
MTSVTVLLALLLDAFFGEPSRFHPLVGFGRVAREMENRCLKLDSSSAWQRACGALATIVIVSIPTAVISLVAAYFEQTVGNVLIAAVILYCAIGARSLAEHARAVKVALDDNTLELARERTGLMVSRDTTKLHENGLTKATIESVLENGSDAVLAPIFWFAVGGIPALVAYRLINTLDAMWGYRSQRYRYFGSTAAVADDLLNWIPARLTALAYTLVGHSTAAVRCWREQARLWDSPNAGPVMAAGAGALRVQLGGAATYHGERHIRPDLGCGAVAGHADINSALTLVRNATILWLLVIATVNVLVVWEF